MALREHRGHSAPSTNSLPSSEARHCIRLAPGFAVQAPEAPCKFITCHTDFPYSPLISAISAYEQQLTQLNSLDLLQGLAAQGWVTASHDIYSESFFSEFSVKAETCWEGMGTASVINGISCVAKACRQRRHVSCSALSPNRGQATAVLQRRRLCCSTSSACYLGSWLISLPTLEYGLAHTTLLWPFQLQVHSSQHNNICSPVSSYLSRSMCEATGMRPPQAYEIWLTCFRDSNSANPQLLPCCRAAALDSSARLSTMSCRASPTSSCVPVSSICALLQLLQQASRPREPPLCQAIVAAVRACLSASTTGRVLTGRALMLAGTGCWDWKQ